jgi:alpha-1,3-glucan synthase
MLDVSDVTMGRHDYKLQKTELTFLDTDGHYHDKFKDMLNKDLNAKSSESSLVIDDYLKLSEKEWAARYKDAKLGRNRSPSPAPHRHHRSSLAQSDHSRRSSSSDAISFAGSTADEFLLGKDFVRPSILKRWLSTRILDWPIYSIFLALGQIMAANSYQIVLLTNSTTKAGQTEKLYIIGGIFIVASVLWWLLFRYLTPRYVLSLPFVFYGLAFLFIGVAPFFPTADGKDWSRNVATGLYSVASASGSLYFALNFGDEGGAPVKSWVFRATLVQGIQQNYIAGLFYVGELLTERSTTGRAAPSITNKPIVIAIAGPIAGILLVISVLLFTSLPPFYRQTPGSVPQLYHSLLRRRLVIWFFISTVLQNYWLSAPYGRNWAFLWSSTFAPKWAVGILLVVFLIGVWILILLLFARLSKTHSWILPIFAFGLIAPRWAQMWWGTSSYGLWLPWLGNPIGGALASRALWLWLGLLDSIQGVGIGIALLQTLTRIHIALVLVTSQLIGAIVTLIAKATAPDKDGPDGVFPDLSAGVVKGIAQPWFWVALVCQIVIPIGYVFWFRKEQLSKP